MRSRAALTAALLVPLAVAGCTSSDHPRSNSTSHSGAATASASPAPPSAKALPPGVVGATRVPTAVPNKPALRADVVLSTCASRSGGWAASGTVHNRTLRPVKYTVTVFFTTDHATVIGAGATTLTLLPKTSKYWSVVAKFHAANPTLCVLRGVG